MVKETEIQKQVFVQWWTWNKNVSYPLLPSSGHEHESSSSVEARNTSRASWSEMSKRSICSSMSTLTSMDEMLLMGATEHGEEKEKNNNPRVLNIINRIISRTKCVNTYSKYLCFTHPSCNLSASVLRRSKHPRHAGMLPQRSAVFLGASAAGPHPCPEASVRSPFQLGNKKHTQAEIFQTN